MSANGEDEKFNYTGYLVFNGLYTTTFKEGFSQKNTIEQVRTALDERLPPVTKKEENGPKSGYKNLDLEHYLEAQRAEKLGLEHHELAEQLLGKEFVNETVGKEEEILSNDGERVEGEVLRRRNAYLYWLLPDLLIIQGSNPNVNSAESHLHQVFGTNGGNTPDLKLDPLEFDSHFLLWMIYQDYQGNEVGQEINIHQINSVEIQGGKDFFGETAQVTGSTNIIRSTPFIEGLFKNKLPVEIEALYNIAGQNLVAEIRDNGRVHIKSEVDIGSASKLERVLMGLEFVRRLTRLRWDWEYFDPENKYVPPSFIVELDEIAEEQDIEIDFRREIIPELLEKRGEDPDDWELDFS